MKKKLIITLTACLLAAGSFINMHMGQNVHSMDFSLDDITAMAQADSESGSRICMAGGCYATSCTFSGTIMVLGSGVTVSNGTSCIDGKYACCYLTAYCFDASEC